MPEPVYQLGVTCYARCAMRVFSALLLLISLTPKLLCQLPAPGALSDAKICTRFGCTWVPDTGDVPFERNDVRYFVDIRQQAQDGDFVIERGATTVLRTPLKDLNASVSVLWTDDDRRLAVTWSDGGAIGNFHVRVFEIRDSKGIELPAVTKAEVNFRSRHFCQTRGNNVQAYRWATSDTLVLVTSVYPTGDCGPDLGHMEGYFVEVESGRIVRHLTSKQLRAYLRLHRE